MTGLGWAARSLGRRPLRTALSLAGIAVAAAMLLDMVMLSGGMERSFRQLLLGRGYQIRLTPKGTLPFDTEATLPGVSRLVAALRAESAIEAAGPVLGAAVFARRAGAQPGDSRPGDSRPGDSRPGDSLVTLVGYGLDPRAQALYQLQRGRDLAPGDSAGLLLSAPAATALRVRPGDTLVLVGRLDPQTAGPAAERRLVARGVVRFLFDYRGQRSVAAGLPTMQALTRQREGDRASLVMVKVREGRAVETEADRLRARFPRLEVNSVSDLVASFRERMVYFNQLSFILATVSLIVAVLLVATLLTITVNERLGEIATLRAIGVSRATVVRQVLAEGAALTLAGAALGLALGLVTARYLDAILTSFPGLPAAFSFFVPRADSLAIAAGVLLLTGAVAGVYPAWLAARLPIAATLRAEAN